MEKIKQEMELKNWDNDIAATIYSDSFNEYKDALTSLANSILNSDLNNVQKIEKWEKESENWHTNYCKEYFKNNYDDLKKQTIDLLLFAKENKLDYNEVIGSYAIENNIDDEFSEENLEDRIDSNIGYECDICFEEVTEEIDFEYLIENNIKKYISEE